MERGNTLWVITRQEQNSWEIEEPKIVGVASDGAAADAFIAGELDAYPYDKVHIVFRKYKTEFVG